jgi:6-phosphofructokinase 1
VPKTIDNDLDLPAHVDTFGFQTARHYGVDIVKNLMVDAKTTSRWYFVITMGRGAGHLAVGIGKAAGATLTLIPEEFREKGARLKAIVDTLVGAIIKRLSYGRRDGVAVIAEGLVLGIEPAELAGLEEVERDTHGNVRIAEVNIGEVLKAEVTKRLRVFGLKTTIVAKNIGYELRCADPIPMDMEYTRDLGYCAAKYVLGGGQRGRDLDPSGEIRPDSVSNDDRRRHRAAAHAKSGHHVDALRHRAPLYDPPAA